jgi:glucose-1-phosphate adenylyltransferase
MNVLGLIFSATNKNEQFELAQKRTIASVPVYGRYRLIDFSLSNMVNSNIFHVGIVTKSNYQSLMDHVGNGREWDLSRKNGGLAILPPYGASVDFFNSRLEALKSIITFINHAPEEYVLLTDCYHICNMDYSDIIDTHIKTGADITCVYREQVIDNSTYKPVKTFNVDENNRIIDLIIDSNHREIAKVSLDIWVMKKELLQELVIDSIVNNLNSFNSDILKANLNNLKIFGYNFTGYFRDINSLKTYFDLNMELLNKKVRSELFNKEQFPIYTKVRDSSPTKYGMNAKVTNSIIADGCVIDGIIENSIIFRGVKVAPGSMIRNSILMQDTEIRDGCEINFVISDKNVKVINQKEIKGSINDPIYIKKNEVR